MKKRNYFFSLLLIFGQAMGMERNGIEKLKTYEGFEFQESKKCYQGKKFSIVRAYMKYDIISKDTNFFSGVIKYLYNNNAYSLQKSNDGCCAGYSPSRRILGKKIFNELDEESECGFFSVYISNVAYRRNIEKEIIYKMIENREMKLYGCSRIFTNVKNKKFKKYFIEKGYKDKSIQSRHKARVILTFNMFLESIGADLPNEIKTIIFRYCDLDCNDVHSFINKNLNYYDSNNNKDKKFFGFLNSPPCLEKCVHGEAHHGMSDENFDNENKDNIIMYKQLNK